MLNIYIPTTPNPTSGYLVFLDRNEIITLDMTVEDALKMVISGGIVTPDYVDKKLRFDSIKGRVVETAGAQAVKSLCIKGF